MSQLNLVHQLYDNGYLDTVYETLDDPAEVVVTLMKVMNDTRTMPQCIENYKSEYISNVYRSEGNQAYKALQFREALENYNKSLCHAPVNSTAMTLAYSNRSALLYTVKAYSACVNDIDTIFSMGSTNINHELAQRLRQRKIQCKQIAINTCKGGIAGNFFNFNVRRHPEIPCASTDINVIMESGLPKVVAARDIAVGTLVALESPFASELHPENYWIACHYCHKFTLNLMPCDGCCATMFCDEICKEKCYTEYHNIECQIMKFYRDTDAVEAEVGSRMKIRAALKMKQKCKSWKELIAASHSIGKDRMRNSCVNDIYDGKRKFSILNYNINLHFVHGKILNCGLSCAVDLHHLGNIQNFLPTNTEEQDAAVRALARIMMNLHIFYPKIEILNTCMAMDVDSNDITTNVTHNYGWFAFTSKLKHSCDANLLALGLKNNIALIALHPIRKGTELKISYLGHYYENIPVERSLRLFVNGQTICDCRVCVEGWNSRHFKEQKLTAHQKRLYKEWNSNTSTRIINRDTKVFKATCKALAELQDIAGTQEHHHIFKELRLYLSFCQYVATNNIFLQHHDDDLEVVFT